MRSDFKFSEKKDIKAAEKLMAYMTALKGKRSWGEYARDVDMSEAYMSFIRNGKRPINTEIAEKLVERSAPTGKDVKAADLVDASRQMIESGKTDLFPGSPDANKGYVPRRIANRFAAAVRKWVDHEYNVEHFHEMFNIVMNSDFKTNVPGLKPDLLYRMDDGGECLVKYVYVPSTDDETGLVRLFPGIRYRKGGAGAASKEMSEEEIVAKAYQFVFNNMILLPAVSAKYDPKRRILVVTNSRLMYGRLASLGRDMSYRGNIFVMMADLEDESIVKFNSFAGTS